MPAADFLTNVETAFLTVIQTNAILALYNWERWDSDRELKLPRGHVQLSARPDDETAYYKVKATFTFEGRPKKQKLSIVVNEFKALMQVLDVTDLSLASGNTVTFIGKAIDVSEDRRIMGGLRNWVYEFSIYAVPMS
jgi:hypothetical protein